VRLQGGASLYCLSNPLQGVMRVAMCQFAVRCMRQHVQVSEQLEIPKR
jgi:hypothetical protein